MLDLKQKTLLDYKELEGTHCIVVEIDPEELEDLKKDNQRTQGCE